MKINEMPEKIYVHKCKYIGLLANEHNITKSCIEYTRTDTFIENACTNLKKLMYDNLMFQGRLHREEVINNFVEDFKKYMKGE